MRSIMPSEAEVRPETIILSGPGAHAARFFARQIGQYPVRGPDRFPSAIALTRDESRLLEGLATGGLPMPTHEQETIIPFAPAPTSTTSGNADQLDRAGQTILQLLNRAASVAEQNSRNAIEIAQALSHKLRAAEGRIAELEAQAAAYQEKAERAEQWLHRVYTDIQDRFLRQDQNALPGPLQRHGE
jgi:hypothetical protein